MTQDNDWIFVCYIHEGRYSSQALYRNKRTGEERVFTETHDDDNWG